MPNPNDATLRNVRAGSKRDAQLLRQIRELQAEVNDIKRRLDLIETGRTKLRPSDSAEVSDDVVMDD